MKYVEKNKQAASMVDIIGKDATKYLERVAKESISWLEVTDIMKDKFKLTGFQLGMLLGYFNGFQAAMTQYGIVVGGR